MSAPPVSCRACTAPAAQNSTSSARATGAGREAMSSLSAHVAQEAFMTSHAFEDRADTLARRAPESQAAPSCPAASQAGRQITIYVFGPGVRCGVAWCARSF